MPPNGDSGEITRLLVAHRQGDDEAFEKLVPLVYADLRRIARQQLAHLRPGNTLDTTALVHEAYLKLVDQTLVELADRRHFFAIAARSMRDLLVDEARRRGARKRGGGVSPVSLDRVELGVDEQVEVVLAIDHALVKLGDLNERLIRVFECRFFAGFSEEETAQALDLPLRTVQRDWMKSKAWLRRELGATPP
jgi:RNA polymerase sigma factor (TIGR02999 family)